LKIKLEKIGGNVTSCAVNQIIRAVVICYYITRIFVMCTPYQILFGLRHQIKKNEMGEEFSTYGERRGACRGLVRKPDGEKLLGKPRRGWEDNIKWMFKKGLGAWTGLIWLSIGTVGEFL
jgi:hypothetical protein